MTKCAKNSIFIGVEAYGARCCASSSNCLHVGLVLTVFDELLVALGGK